MYQQPLTCGQGQYLSSGSCASCQAGRYQSSSSHTESTCPVCSAGHFTASSSTDSDGSGVTTGASHCNDCPAGMYSAYSDSGCEVCAAGQTAPAGSEALSDCLPPAPSASSAPVPSPSPSGAPTSTRQVVTVASTTQGAVDAGDFVAALADALDGIDPTDIEITSYEMTIETSATVAWDCSQQDAAKAQFLEGIKQATGVETVTINDATSDFGCRRRQLTSRRLQGTEASVDYTVIATDPGVASSVAASMSDTAAFANMLKSSVNSAGSVLNVATIIVDPPDIQTVIEHQVSIDADADASAVTAAAESPGVMLAVVQAAAVEGTAPITEAPENEAELPTDPRFNAQNDAPNSEGESNAGSENAAIGMISAFVLLLCTTQSTSLMQLLTYWCACCSLPRDGGGGGCVVHIRSHQICWSYQAGNGCAANCDRDQPACSAPAVCRLPDRPKCSSRFSENSV